MRKWKPVEVAAGVSVVLSAFAATVPAFARSLRASRFAEAFSGLSHLTSQAAALAVARAVDGPFPESVGLTPPQVPQGRPASDPPGTWTHPTWRALGFEQANAHHFSFAFQSELDGPKVRFRALAHGDLDGDGVLSTFSQRGEATSGGEAVLDTVILHREVE